MTVMPKRRIHATITVQGDDLDAWYHAFTEAIDAVEKLREQHRLVGPASCSTSDREWALEITEDRAMSHERLVAAREAVLEARRREETTT